MSAKAATLAKNNEHARTVAQEQSQLSQSKLSEMTNTVTGRLAKADAARTTLVEKKAAASGEHVEHAKAVAAEQKQLKEAALSEKKKALDAKSAAADLVFRVFLGRFRCFLVRFKWF